MDCLIAWGVAGVFCAPLALLLWFVVIPDLIDDCRGRS